MKATAENWYAVSNVGEVPSPALLVYPDRVQENLRRMVKISGAPDRLRPHVKTHKLAEIVKMQLALGITRFKCATIAEAEMTASAGAPDVLLAYQPVGPNVQRFLNLIAKFPKTRFAAVVDDQSVVFTLAETLAEGPIANRTTIELLVDVDCGMHRTGIELPKAAALYRFVSKSPGIVAGGIHAYDGHIHDSSVAERTKAADAAYQAVRSLREELTASGFPVPRTIMSGTPTFPIHARRTDLECSPGTCVLWDHGYATKMPDLDFLPAALVLTRVISKPENNRLCLDLGHKAIASENPHPRVHFLNLPEAKAVTHSEEHLVVETDRACEFRVGDCLYGIPWHICPTVALHSDAVVVKNGRAEERWKITARERKISV